MPPNFFSFIAHKEWRFIIYSLPLLNIAGSVALTRLNRLGTRSQAKRIHRLIGELVLLSIPLFWIMSQISLSISMSDYPGGVALSDCAAVKLEVSIVMMEMVASIFCIVFLFYIDRKRSRG